MADSSNFEEEHLFETKVETLLEQEITTEPIVTDELEQLPHFVGPEDTTYNNEFQMCQLLYRGQFMPSEMDTYVVRSNSVDEFKDNLFHLIRPFIKRKIEFVTPYEPVWAPEELPRREDLPLYVKFKDCIRKRTFDLEIVDENMLLKWSIKTLVLQVYIHSSNVLTKPLWDVARQILFETPKEPTASDEFEDAVKVHAIMKRLKNIHGSYLVPKVEDAFKLWAAQIFKAPVGSHGELIQSRPPAEMLENFNVVGKKSKKTVVKKRKRVFATSGPARREQTTDGFGFEDEIRVLRQTVTQMRDLVDMMDARVGLLEYKSQGFRQPTPKKKAKVEDKRNDDSSDDEENGNEVEEPVIDEPADGGQTSGEANRHGRPDPLLFNDLMVFVKEEDDEIEDDD